MNCENGIFHSWKCISKYRLSQFRHFVNMLWQDASSSSYNISAFSVRVILIDVVDVGYHWGRSTSNSISQSISCRILNSFFCCDFLEVECSFPLDTIDIFTYILRGCFIVLGQLCACLCSDVTMSAMTSQMTDVSIVCSTVFSGPDQRPHQSSTSLAFFVGNPPVTGGFLAQRASNVEIVSTWWRHTEYIQ